MPSLLLFIKITLLMFVSGLGLSWYLNKNREQALRLLLAPFYGVAYVTILAQNFDQNGFSVTQAHFYIIIAILISYLPIILSKSNNSVSHSPVFFSHRYYLYILFFGTLSGLLLLYPLLSKNTLTWMGNGTDATGYIRYAEYLLDNTIHNLAQAHENYPWYIYVHEAAPLDFLQSSFLLAIISSFLDLDPYEVFSPLMAFYGFLVAPALFIVLKFCFRLPIIVSTLASFLLAIQHFWIVPGYYSFLNQMSAIPFFILLIGFIFRALSSSRLQDSLQASLFATVLFSSYGMLIPVILPGTILYSLYIVYQRQSWSPLLTGVMMFSIPMILLGDFWFQYFNRGLFLATTVIPGLTTGLYFDSLLKYIAAFFGFWSIFTNWMAQPLILKFAASFWILIFGISMGGGILLLPRNSRIYWGLILITILGLLTSSMVSDYSYGSWKLMTVSSFLFIGAFSLFVAPNHLSSLLNRMRSLAAGIILAILLISSLVNLQSLVNHRTFVCPETLLELRQLKQLLPLQEEETVGLYSRKGNILEFLTLSFILKDIPLSISKEDPYRVALFINNVFKNQAYKERFMVFRKKKQDNFPEKAIWQNRDFIVYSYSPRLQKKLLSHQ